MKRAVVILLLLNTGYVMLSSSQTSTSSLPAVDHLVFAAPDLDQGIAEIERLTGVRATPGGSHPGRGTRNALASLGPDSYLEIIAPDPQQPAPDFPRMFGIDSLKKSKLVTWAAKGHNLEQFCRDAAKQGVEMEEVRPGSRRRPDGVTLSWQTTGLKGRDEDIIPFFIDWGASPHPSQTAPQGLKLIELRAEHPEAQRILNTLHALGVNLPVTQGGEAALAAVIEGPRGRVELR